MSTADTPFERLTRDEINTVLTAAAKCGVSVKEAAAVLRQLAWPEQAISTADAAKSLGRVIRSLAEKGKG